MRYQFISLGFATPQNGEIQSLLNKRKGVFSIDFTGTPGRARFSPDKVYLSACLI